MLKARELILYYLNHSLCKTPIVLTLLLILGACSGSHNDTQILGNKVSGNAVKGVITNGLVNAYAVEANKGDATNTKRSLLDQARTNSAGEYEINIPALTNNPIIVLELTADSQTTMRCDLVDGCLYAQTFDASNITLAEFGEELPVPSHFKLIGYKQNINQKNAYISPLSHIIYTTASALPGGISNSNLDTASNWVAEIFNLEASLLTEKTPDLTALADLTNLTSQQLKLGLLSSAFYELTMSDDWSTGDIELNQLPLEEIFRDVAYAAETLSRQLSSEESGYSAALSVINSEAEAIVQTFESKQLVIIQQPNSLTVNEAQSFSLNVQASGDGALSYQWAKNNINILGANSASYSIASTNLSDAGSYNVTITNNGNLIISLNALVSVNKTINPVSITKQPQALNLTTGDAINLSVDVSGDGPFYYQWQKEGSLLLGETNHTLHIIDSTEANSGTYRVIVSNDVSETSSNFVSVIVNAATSPVTINQQPQNLTVIEGETAHFHISATGGGFITYQWRKNSVNIPNAYTDNFAINITDMDSSGDYDVIVTNSRGSRTSSSAALTILSLETPVSIAIQPASGSIFLTDNINLRTTASGGGILRYQWFFNDQIIIGANQAEYSINSATLEHEGSYSVIVNNTDSSEESLAAFISVTARPLVQYSVKLSWDIPSFREDRSPLDTNEISAYILEYGDSPSADAKSSVKLTDANITHYTILDLEPGILYARIATIDSSDVQGQFSTWISITIE
ncbi:MAG: putative nucleic acid-binding Zn-ribbon protein [Oleiphilaceae bacterium]|jgi:predicted  nucleic acid-binding Zn-ribbon protein